MKEERILIELEFKDGAGLRFVAYLPYTATYNQILYYVSLWLTVETKSVAWSVYEV